MKLIIEEKFDKREITAVVEINSLCKNIYNDLVEKISNEIKKDIIKETTKFIKNKKFIKDIDKLLKEKIKKEIFKDENQKIINTKYCPECGEKILGWKSPQGTFAPEAYATLREQNIDTRTGHKLNCIYNKK